jgi:hypothetical protein
MEALIPAFSMAGLPPEVVGVKEAESGLYNNSKGMEILKVM